MAAAPLNLTTTTGLVVESSADMFPAQQTVVEGSHTSSSSSSSSSSASSAGSASSHNDGMLQTPTREQTRKFLRPNYNTQQSEASASSSSSATTTSPRKKSKLSLGGARKKVINKKACPVVKKQLNFGAQQQQQQPQPQLEMMNNNRAETCTNGGELPFISLTDSLMANMDMPSPLSTSNNSNTVLMNGGGGGGAGNLDLPSLLASLPKTSRSGAIINPNNNSNHNQSIVIGAPSSVNNIVQCDGLCDPPSNGGDIMTSTEFGGGSYNPTCHHTHSASTNMLGLLAKNVMQLSTFMQLYNKSARGNEDGAPIQNHQVFIESARFVENDVSTVPNINVTLAPVKKKLSKVFFNKSNRALLMPVMDLSESLHPFYLSALATLETFECIYSKIASNDHSRTQLSFDNDREAVVIVYTGSSITLEKTGREGKRSHFRFCFSDPAGFVQEISQVQSVMQYYLGIEDLRQVMSNFMSREFSNCNCYRNGNFKVAHNCILSYYYSLQGYRPLPHINAVFGDVLGTLREFLW